MVSSEQITLETPFGYHNCRKKALEALLWIRCQGHIVLQIALLWKFCSLTYMWRHCCGALPQARGLGGTAVGTWLCKYCCGSIALPWTLEPHVRRSGGEWWAGERGNFGRGIRALDPEHMLCSVHYDMLARNLPCGIGLSASLNKILQ